MQRAFCAGGKAGHEGQPKEGYDKSSAAKDLGWDQVYVLLYENQPYPSQVILVQIGILPIIIHQPC